MGLTDEVWAALPDYVRTADEGLELPLFTWLSGLCDLVQPTVDLLADADLANPATTVRGMLPFVAAIGGVDITGVPDADVRNWIAAEVSRKRGSAAAIVARVGLTLTGTKWVGIETNYLADPMRIRVSTWTSETPDTAATNAAVAREVPAWLRVTTRTLAGMTYTDLTATYTLYSDMTATAKTYAVLTAET